MSELEPFRNEIWISAAVFALAILLINAIFLPKYRNTFVTRILNPRGYLISRTLWIDQPIETKLEEIYKKLTALEKLHEQPPIVDRKFDGQKKQEISVNFPFGWIFTLILIIASLIIFPTLVVILLLQSKYSRNAIKAGAVAVAGEFALLMAITPKFDKIIELNFSPHIEFPQGTDEPKDFKWEQLIALRAPYFQSGQTTLDCGERTSEGNTFRIWPFPVGLAALEDAKDSLKGTIRDDFKKLEGQVVSIIENLSRDGVELGLHRKRSVVAILVIGSADPRNFKENRKLFSSNSGLSQARAEWVRARLEKAESLKSATILTLSSGPTFSRITLENSSEQFAFDRAVQVCALWETAN